VKILFTGSSSFTGYWFVTELVGAGHEVVATFRRNPTQYEGVRKERVKRLQKMCECVFNAPLGGEAFLSVVGDESSWDMFCHHAAQVEGYDRPDFDVLSAVANNTCNLEVVLDELLARKCRRLVLTGSIFESREGAGEEPLRAFSSYGLSKSLTAQFVRHLAEVRSMSLGKFVIPNPFGPFEEPRFTSYLVREWYQDRTALVRSPDYIRDNIHVDLLAKAYRSFAKSMPEAPGFRRYNPSGSRSTQGQFARRFAEEMRPRLNLACDLSCAEQSEFLEPRERVNTDELDPAELGWHEADAWDGLARYYRDRFEGS
jgi:nucleoside-diphosphate-sugar epimerase